LAIRTIRFLGELNYYDEAQRAIATEEQRRKKGVPLASDEEVLLKMFASQWYSKGIYHNWRPGHLYITDRRVFLFRKEPAEVLFQCPYKEIKRLVTERKNNIAGKETDYLYLLLSSGEVAQLHPSDAQAVKDTIEERMKTLGLGLEETIPFPTLDETARQFLSNGEQLLHSGKMSHLVAEPRPGIITTNVWKAGHLYLTSQRLVWWYDFDGKVVFEVPLDKISGVEVKRKDLGGMLKNKPVLDLVYRNDVANEIASFSDAVEELNQWQKMIGEVMAQHYNGINAKNDIDSVSGIRSTDTDTNCGWVSPRLKGQEVKV